LAYLWAGTTKTTNFKLEGLTVQCTALAQAEW